MKKNNPLNNGIPIAASFDFEMEREDIRSKKIYDKKRLAAMAGLAFLIAACISVIAKLLVYLINLVTNISFHGKISVAVASPAHNTYGLFVILVPIIGGLLVGLMALYGSKAIRGHGIPEAMEQILTNQSKIRPTITYLKPLSAAISIGPAVPLALKDPLLQPAGHWAPR